MSPLVVPAGIVGALAIAAFALALIGIATAPIFARSRRFTGPSAALTLLPFAILAVAAVLAAASTALGAVTAHRLGMREVATGALAVICATPVLGALAVRLRYGPTGTRTFRHQIAANRVSAALLVAVLLEVLAVTGFLIGGAVGIVIDMPLLTGLVFAGISVAATVVATLLSLRGGGRFLLETVGARAATTTGREQQLRNVVAELAAAAGMSAPQVYVIPSEGVNALAVGTDPANASIAVTRGLLELMDREELQGVVAHELAHIRNLDSRHGVLVALLVGAVVLLTEVFLHAVVEIATNPSIGGDSIGEVVAGLVIWIVISAMAILFAGTLRLLAPLAARAVQAAVSRDREYLADITAVEITRNPAGLIAALRKLDAPAARMPSTNAGTQHLWIVNPLREGRSGGHGWFDTHPSTQERIARLRALGGEDAPREDVPGEVASREDASRDDATATRS